MVPGGGGKIGDGGSMVMVQGTGGAGIDLENYVITWACSIFDGLYPEFWLYS